MLAFAPRYRSPWDCSEDTLPAVSLESLLLEIEASGRPAHRQATIRKAMGLPLTNPGLEQTLKRLGYWPEDARPLAFDIADLLFMQPRLERASAYGIMAGLPVKTIAKQLGYSVGHIHLVIRTGQERLHMLADCFGAIGDGDKAHVIPCKTILSALGVTGNRSEYATCEAFSLPWKGVSRRAFLDTWLSLPRWEDVPDFFVHQIRSYVIADTYGTYFCNRPGESWDWPAPGPEWLNEEQAIKHLRSSQTLFSKLLKGQQVIPHLIPFHKGAWYNQAQLDALRTPAMAAT